MRHRLAGGASEQGVELAGRRLLALLDNAAPSRKSSPQMCLPGLPDCALHLSPTRLHLAVEIDEMMVLGQMTFLDSTAGPFSIFIS